MRAGYSGRRIASLTLLMICGMSLNSFALERCTHLISAGNQEFTAYQTARSIGELSGESICAEASSGSLENLYSLLNRDDVIAGMVQSDVVKLAVRKNPQKMESISLVLPLKPELVHLLVREDSEARTFGDLANKVICVGQQGSGSLFTALQVKALTHSSWIEAREGFSRCMGMLDRSSVDAVFVVSNPPVSTLSGKIGSQYRLIALPSIPGYQSAVIDSYSSEEAVVPAVDSIAVETMLLVKDQVIRREIRISNKMATGVAGILNKLDIDSQDRICTKEIEDGGLSFSFIHKKACSLGYYGQDW